MRTLTFEEQHKVAAIRSDYQIEPMHGRESFTVLSLDPDLNLKRYEVDVVDMTCTCRGYEKWSPRIPGFACRHLLMTLDWIEKEDASHDGFDAKPDDVRSGAGGLPGVQSARGRRESRRRLALPPTVRGPQPGTHRAPYTLCLATRLTRQSLAAALPGYLWRKVRLDAYPHADTCDYPRVIHEAWMIAPEDVAEIERLLLDDSACTCPDEHTLDVDCPVPEHEARAWAAQQAMQEALP
ncbi:MAG: hypothetical protein CMLOHMNK_02052 [Steroidobacteraceae bacterium]|nr:hypothetical protein [Steroidobacteraceae bacterium]